MHIQFIIHNGCVYNAEVQIGYAKTCTAFNRNINNIQIIYIITI